LRTDFISPILLVKQYARRFDPRVKYPQGNYVYFLWHPFCGGDDIIYLGRTSRSLNLRLACHKRFDFTYATFLAVDPSYTKHDMIQIEKFFLCTISPPCNGLNTTNPTDTRWLNRDIFNTMRSLRLSEEYHVAPRGEWL